MECVTGGTLKEHIFKEGPLPDATAVELTLQIARALEAAHRRGVVYRDIKPQNVLLTESGEAKVADFGIARAAASSTMTNTGSHVGTAHYLSPEQALGQPAGPKSDLYSLGVILYEMLTGELPHDAETPMGIAMKRVNKSLRPPKEVNPDVPEGINGVCVRLLARNPEDRYRGAAELIGDLERVQREEFPAAALQRGTSDGGSSAPQKATPVRTPDGPSAVPQAPPARSKRMVLLATAVGLLLLLLTGGVATALTGFGPVAGLLGGWGESQPVAEAPAVQPSDGSTTEATDDQKGATTEKASAAQASAAQPNQGSSPAAVSDGGGTTEQSSASGTNGKQSNSAGTDNSGSDQGSSESNKEPVPSVVGLPYGEAVKALKDQGFRQLGGGLVERNKPQGTVISTSPAAGTLVDPTVTTILQLLPSIRATGGSSRPRTKVPVRARPFRKTPASERPSGVLDSGAEASRHASLPVRK
jgi:eukaryotic-like serine/threonine-protein kinase